MTNKVLKKRIPRGMKENLRRWLALFLMTAAGMYLVVSVVGAAENIITGSRKSAEENGVESGGFSTFVPLTDPQEEALRGLGIILERMFSVDIRLEDGSVLRLMKNRVELNRVVTVQGRTAEKEGEIVLEKRYCGEHGYVVGDTFRIASTDFLITGIGSTPDYDLPVRSLSDMSVDSRFFGTAFVTSEQYEKILSCGMGGSEAYTYAYRLEGGVTDEEVKQALMESGSGSLTMFVTANENPRILAAAGDMVMNKEVGLFAGVVVLALFAYVISVFLVHQINRESNVIGTLYALGVKKKDLLLHYITLPTLVTLSAGLLGTAFGFSGLGMARQAASAYAYFSIPVFDAVYPVYLIIYAVIMPPVTSVTVNVIVINKRLSQTALSLIRNEKKPSKLRAVKLKGKRFVRNFRIRHMLSETRTGITVVIGMFISLLIFMLGLNCLILCQNVRSDSVDSTKYEYMYTLRQPEKAVPAGGEPCYIHPLSKTGYGYTLEISLMGIRSGNKYFDAEPSGGKNRVVLGDSTAAKYGLGVGDEFLLTDSACGTEYVFTVEGICSYSVGLAAFMDIGSMRELFGQEDGYYNMLLSDEMLEIDGGKVHSVMTRADVEHSAAVFVDLMLPMVAMMVGASVIVFFMVVYLMMGVMIDHAGFGISLIKIFGFRRGEIRRLYLDGNTVPIVFGALLGIPASKKLTDALYPRLVANVACGMNLHFGWHVYLLIFAGIMLVYGIASALLMNKINRITPEQVLKNRE